MGFFELVRNRGSLAVRSVGDGVTGENWMAVPLDPTGDGVCEYRGGIVGLAWPIGVFVGV